MTDRERLIELKINFVENFDCGDCKPSNNKCRKCLSEKEADYLLEHGVIALPCKVGDKVYEVTTSEEIEQRKVKDIIYDNEGFRLRLEPYFSYEYYLNETVFLTREEAEKAAKERESNE